MWITIQLIVSLIASLGLAGFVAIEWPEAGWISFLASFLFLQLAIFLVYWRSRPNLIPGMLGHIAITYAWVVLIFWI